MNSELRSWYLALSDSDKQSFLALVASQLTIHGRAIGREPVGEEQVKAFKGLNELQHQLSGHIAAIGLRRDRYPDAVLWDILHEKAASFGLLAHLKQSLDSAKSRNVWTDRK